MRSKINSRLGLINTAVKPQVLLGFEKYLTNVQNTYHLLFV